ncbi:hypothetical protein KRP22_007724 [Phytophthora ramorum]|nr:hypothetical protein KRP22_4263 [Phytophthora ramorum]
MRTSLSITIAALTAGLIFGDATATTALRGINDVSSETRKLDEVDGSGSTAPLDSIDGSLAGLEEKGVRPENNGYQKTICQFNSCWKVDIFTNLKVFETDAKDEHNKNKDGKVDIQALVQHIVIIASIVKTLKDL